MAGILGREFAGFATCFALKFSTVLSVASGVGFRVSGFSVSDFGKAKRACSLSVQDSRIWPQR